MAPEGKRHSIALEAKQVSLETGGHHEPHAGFPTPLAEQGGGGRGVGFLYPVHRLHNSIRLKNIGTLCCVNTSGIR